MNFEKIRADVIEGAIKCQDMGLIHGTSGNVSIADREFGIAVITPSGIPYQDLCPEDVPVLISLEDGRVIEGEKKPSKETPMPSGNLSCKTQNKRGGSYPFSFRHSNVDLSGGITGSRGGQRALCAHQSCAV